MKKAYILNQKIDREFNAAGKAMRDVFKVFTENGVKVMPGVSKDASKILKIFDLPILCFYMLFVMGKGDYCIFSYPENTIKIKLLKKLAPVKKVNVVCFINDINSIRDGHFDDENVKKAIEKDMSLIGSANIVIAPNKNSKKFLQEQGIKSNIITVGTWDYIMEEAFDIRNVYHEQGKKWVVAFAGNLDKAPFINSLHEVKGNNLKFKLWGNCRSEIPNNDFCEYMGSVSPEELPFYVCGCNIGLVWDGTSVHGCEGGLGEYLQYNNSHKCGLYLASGLPVIVWKRAGLADFVLENKCGFVVESLDEIPGILEKMSEAEYIELIKNVNGVSENIRKGYYLKKSLEEMYKL